MAIEFALFGIGADDGQALLGVNRQKGYVELEFEAFGYTYTIHRGLARRGNSVNQEACSLSSGGVVTNYAPRELKAKVLEILRFNEPNTSSESKIFRYSIFTPQEEMKTILSINQEGRLQILRRAFGIEDYKVASSNLVEISKYLRQKSSDVLNQAFDLEEKSSVLSESRKKAGMLEDTARSISGNISAINERLSKVREEHENLRVSLESMEAKSEKRIKILSDIDSRQKSLVELQARRNRQLTALEKKNAFIESKAGTSASTKNPENLMETISSLRKELAHITASDGESRERIRSLSASRGSIQKDLDSAVRELQILSKREEIEESRIREKRSFIEARSSVPQPSADLEALGAEIAELQRSMSSKTTEFGGLKSKLEDYSSILKLGVCPTCDSPVDPVTFEPRIKARQKEFDEIEREIEGITAKLKSLQVDREGAILNRSIREEMRRAAVELKQMSEDLQSTVEAIERQKHHIEEKQQEIEAMDREIQNANLAVQSSSSEIRNLEEKIQAMEKEREQAVDRERAMEEVRRAMEDVAHLELELREIDRDISKVTNEEQSLKNEAANLGMEIASLESVKAGVSSARKTIEQEEALLGEERRKLGEAEGSRKQLMDSIGLLQVEVDRKTAMRARSSRIMDYVSWIEQFLVPTLELVEKNAMVSLNNEFNESIQTFFGMLVDDPGKTIRVDESFTPIVEQDGMTQDISYLSGGERTSVALSYRLTLNRMVKHHVLYSDKNPLILDEPTDGFSREQLLRVREILELMDASQVIIVSHEKDMESFADQIFRVSKSDGISRLEVG